MGRKHNLQSSFPIFACNLYYALKTIYIDVNTVYPYFFRVSKNFAKFKFKK